MRRRRNTAPCSHLASYLQAYSNPIILVHRMLPWTSAQKLAVSLIPSRAQFKYLEFIRKAQASGHMGTLSGDPELPGMSDWRSP